MTTAKRCPGVHGQPCGSWRDRPDQRYCRQCRADYMRAWRRKKKAEIEVMIEQLANRDGALRPVTAVTLLLIALGFAAIFALGRACAPRQPGRTEIDTVTVGEATHDRPTPTPRPTILHDTVPVAVEVTREVPDSALVRNYAALALAYAKYRAEIERRAREHDTTPAPPAPREVLPPMALSYSGRVLTMWLTPSSGRIAKFTAHVQPHWSAVAGRGGLSDTRPVVVQDRAWVRTSREIKECLVPAAVFTLLGALVVPKQPALGAIGGGVLGTGACLWD